MVIRYDLGFGGWRPWLPGACTRPLKGSWLGSFLVIFRANTLSPLGRTELPLWALRPSLLVPDPWKGCGCGYMAVFIIVCWSWSLFFVLFPLLWWFTLYSAAVALMSKLMRTTALVWFCGEYYLGCCCFSCSL